MRRTGRFALGIAAALTIGGLLALGNWQIERRAWKHALMDRVAQRVHAPPVAAPRPDEWPRVGAASHEYLRLRVSGRWLPCNDTFVQASTEFGSGWWLLTPLRQADGSVVIVNRGFLPSRRIERALPAPSEVSLVGLLRLSEPGGGFLRRNDPAAERWYSRDVAAIAAARGLAPVAPFFIDAERAGSQAADAPVAGLTVIAFADHHLIYAITWFALAAMLAGAAVTFVNLERRGTVRNE